MKPYLVFPQFSRIFASSSTHGITRHCKTINYTKGGCYDKYRPQKKFVAEPKFWSCWNVRDGSRSLDWWCKMWWKDIFVFFYLLSCEYSSSIVHERFICRTEGHLCDLRRMSDGIDVCNDIHDQDFSPQRNQPYRQTRECEQQQHSATQCAPGLRTVSNILPHTLHHNDTSEQRNRCTWSGEV